MHPTVIAALLSPKDKLVIYGVRQCDGVPGEPLDLEPATRRGHLRTPPAHFPKIAPILRELVTMIGPGRARQPIATT